MEKRSGYAFTAAKFMVKPQLSKRLFGKPFLKYGQCFALMGSFFQIGGVLGAKHGNNLDAFCPAFLGLSGEPGAAQDFFSAAIQDEVGIPAIGDQGEGTVPTITEYVLGNQMKRLRYAGSPGQFLAEYMMNKVDSETAFSVVYQFAEGGAIVGAMRPTIFKRMVELTYSDRNEEKWNSARKSGLDIPEKQEKVTYEEIEQIENDRFMQFCQQCYPAQHAALRASGPVV